MRSPLLAALIASLAAAIVTRAIVHAGQGLRAAYAAATHLGGQTHTGVAEEISTAAIADAWSGSPPAQFRATWTGYLVATRSGAYTIATTSDDGSTVTIDGEQVVNNGGDHGPQTRSG